MIGAIGIHVGLEIIGQAVLLLATRHVCQHRWHQVAIWALGTIATSALAVWIVG